MKKKIFMLTLALSLSAATLTGCSSKEEPEETPEYEYEGVGEHAGELEVIPENKINDRVDDTTSEDAANEVDNAGETDSTEGNENTEE